jgi:hypothetical protein
MGDHNWRFAANILIFLRRNRNQTSGTKTPQGESLPSKRVITGTMDLRGSPLMNPHAGKNL